MARASSYGGSTGGSGGYSSNNDKPGKASSPPGKAPSAAPGQGIGTAVSGRDSGGTQSALGQAVDYVGNSLVDAVSPPTADSPGIIGAVLSQVPVVGSLMTFTRIMQDVFGIPGEVNWSPGNPNPARVERDSAMSNPPALGAFVPPQLLGQQYSPPPPPDYTEDIGLPATDSGGIFNTGTPGAGGSFSWDGIKRAIDLDGEGDGLPWWLWVGLGYLAWRWVR